MVCIDVGHDCSWKYPFMDIVIRYLQAGKKMSTVRFGYRHKIHRLLLLGEIERAHNVKYKKIMVF
jgi:hypothetical protein